MVIAYINWIIYSHSFKNSVQKILYSVTQHLAWEDDELQNIIWCGEIVANSAMKQITKEKKNGVSEAIYSELPYKNWEFPISINFNKTVSNP